MNNDVIFTVLLYYTGVMRYYLLTSVQLVTALRIVLLQKMKKLATMHKRTAMVLSLVRQSSGWSKSSS